MSDRFYFIISDENFALGEVQSETPLKPMRWVGVKELEKKVLIHGQSQEWDLSRFLIASAVILRGDKDHRHAVRRRSANRARNIRHQSELTKDYLCRENKMEFNRLKEILAKVLTDIRQELSLPEGNPVEHSYEINDRVLACNMSEVCRNELERFVVGSGSSLIYPKDFERIKSLLKDRFPDESGVVIDAIKATETREHLAALSLSTEDLSGNEIFVSMANAHGQSLTFEGWKFCKLIDDRSKPHLLGTLGRRRDYREPVDTFSFNSNKSGEVIAQFNPEASTLHVICRDEKGNQIHDKATFVLDIDYALCLYVTLKQLREDKERFKRLKEQADTTIPCDLFDNLYTAS